MRCFRPQWLLPAILLPLISGCGTAVSNTCPALASYDQAALTKAADELATLPPGAELRTMIADYGTERAEIRACRGTAP